MASIAKWTVFFLMAFKQSRPISGMPLITSERREIPEKIRILEAIRIGDITGFSEETVLDVLKEINKAGYYFQAETERANDRGGQILRSGQDTSLEEECWREYLTCKAARIDVRKLLDYLESHGRIEIPEHGSTAYYQFITSLV